MRENIFLERIIPRKAYSSPHSLALSLFTKAKFNKLKDLKIWVTEVRRNRVLGRCGRIRREIGWQS
jgi:hypothetical protein